MFGSVEGRGSRRKLAEARLSTGGRLPGTTRKSMRGARIELCKRRRFVRIFATLVIPVRDCSGRVLLKNAPQKIHRTHRRFLPFGRRSWPRPGAVRRG